MSEVVLSKTICENLNEYLKGLYMGIETFEKYVNKCRDLNLKRQLVSIHNLYKDTSSKIINRIIELEGKPVDSIGLTGKIVELFQDIKNITIDTDQEILREALNAFKFGIEMCEKFLSEHELDDSSKSIISNFIDEKKVILKDLQEFNL